MFERICSFRNLELAYRKARKGKRNRSEVAAFEMSLEGNLLQLKRELESGSYKPQPLRTFIVRDPKSRVISASAFRDRVVHHALCNVIAPLFERSLIHDTYANRRGFGTHAALLRYDRFKRRTSRGQLAPHAASDAMVRGYAFKADIRHYFASISHARLRAFLWEKVDDEGTRRLIDTILRATATADGRGLPLGNLTSQFFANIYLHQLDCFVKHRLRARCYLRYVDDFVILHRSGTRLREWQAEIDRFLTGMEIQLHPEKSRVQPLHRGVSLLGFRVLSDRRLLKRSTTRQWLRHPPSLLYPGDPEKADRCLQSRLAHASWSSTMQFHGAT